jgi:hypothetical protein
MSSLLECKVLTWLVLLTSIILIIVSGIKYHELTTEFDNDKIYHQVTLKHLTYTQSQYISDGEGGYYIYNYYHGLGTFKSNQTAMTCWLYGGQPYPGVVEYEVNYESCLYDGQCYDCRQANVKGGGGYLGLLICCPFLLIICCINLYNMSDSTTLPITSQIHEMNEIQVQIAETQEAIKDKLEDLGKI